MQWLQCGFPPLGLKQIEYGVYGDLIIIYPKPYSIYLRGTILVKYLGWVVEDLDMVFVCLHRCQLVLS